MNIQKNDMTPTTSYDILPLTTSILLRFEGFTAVTMKNTAFWDVSVVLVRTDLSEEISASIFRVTRIGELGTTLA
jgi:hypothetical protein